LRAWKLTSIASCPAVLHFQDNTPMCRFDKQILKSTYDASRQEQPFRPLFHGIHTP
jgi:hypothetical protein